MRDRAVGIRWVVIVCLLLVISGGVAVGAETTPSQTTAEDGDVIELQSLASDPREGETVAIELAYYLGDSISELEITVTDATVEAGDGFTEVGENTFEWDGETEIPVLEAETEVEQSAHQQDGSDFAGTDEWALVGAVSTEAQFSGTGDLAFERTMDHDYEGVAGDEMAYVGSYESETVETDAGDIVIVTADEASPPRSTAEVGEILADTVDQFQIAEPRERIYAYIVTDPIRRGGLATSGNADFWVHEDSLEPPRTTLWHEYIHSQQNFRPETDVTWTIEAEADYYAYLLAMKQGHIDYHEFYSALGGADEDHESAILTQPDTWSGQTDYELGALTLAVLDAEIREQSAGTDTYMDVMETKNEEGGDAVMGQGSVTDADLESFVNDAARTDLSPFFDAHIRTEPDSLSVPGPLAYEVSETGSTLDIAVENTVVGAESEGRIEFLVSNTGNGISIAPFIELSVPDEVGDGQVSVSSDSEIGSGVTAVDDGWVIDNLEPGETVTVEYLFDAPEDESTEPDDIDAVVTDLAGESAATSSDLEIVEAPEVSFDTPEVSGPGESVSFEADETVSEQDIVSYTWEIAGPIDETSETDGPTFEYEFAESGEYSVILTVENDDGATATSAADHLVNDEPSVTIDAPEEAEPGEAFLAEANVTNEFGSYELEWEANGLEASAERVEFEFSSDGERELTVTVTDEYGESASESTTVIVGDPQDSDGLQGELADAVGPGFGIPVAMVAFVGLFLYLRLRE